MLSTPTIKTGITLLILVLFGLPIISAQRRTELTPNFILGNKESEALNSVIQDYRGNLVGVGYREGRNKNIYLVSVSLSGDTIFEVDYGFKKDEEAFRITHTFDGGYVLAGYSESKRPDAIGGKDALLLKVDRFGVPVWDYITGSLGDDYFHDIIQAQDGNLIAIGEKNELAFIQILSTNGEMLWNRNLQNIKSKAVRIKNDTLELYYIGGTLFTDTNTVISFIDLFDYNNRVVTEHDTISIPNKAFYLKDFERSKSGFALVGIFMEHINREDMGVVFCDTAFKVFQNEIWQQGGPGEDVCAGVATRADSLIAFGYTYSHARGSRKADGWLQSFSWDKRQPVGRTEFFGGRQMDKILSGVLLQDGQLFVCGQHDQLSNSREDGFFMLIGRESRPEINQMRLLEIRDWEFHTQDGNDTLEGYENGHFTIFIDNLNPSNVFDLKAHLLLLDSIPTITYFTDIYLGYLRAGESRRIGIPIFSEGNLSNGSFRFQMMLTSQNIPSSDTVMLIVPTKRRKEPRFEIIAQEVDFRSPDLADRLEDISLKIGIRNIGDASADSVGYRFVFPQHVLVSSPIRRDLGNIAPGDTVWLSSVFQARSFYDQQRIDIQLTVFEQSFQHGIKEDFSIDLRDFYYRAETPVVVFSRKGAQERKDYKDLEEEAIEEKISWLSPSINERGFPYLDYKLNYVKIKLHIDIGEEINAGNITVYKAGQPLSIGNGLTEGYLELQKGTGSSTTYTYYHKLELDPYINTIFVEVEKGRNTFQSEEIKINYDPLQDNLIIYAFGIPYENLQYNDDDAIDFCNAMLDNAAFANVEVLPYVNPENTTEDRLRKTFRHIPEKCKNIPETDRDNLVIIYLSGHGIIGPKDSIFYILASDYTDKFVTPFALNYYHDFLAYVQNICVPAYIIIDACKSGSINNLTSGISNSQPQLEEKELMLSNKILSINEELMADKVFAFSCGPNESSYQDSKWRNSAFTEAILEAISQMKSGNSANVDLDNDGVLTIRELFKYTAIRVPELVRGEDRSQNPQIKWNKEEWLDWPVYKVKMQTN